MSIDEFNSEFNKLKAPANRVLDKDLVSLETMSSDRRANRYEDIKENEQYFDREFIDEWYDALSEGDIQDTFARFATARLFLHTASLEDDRSQPLAPSDFKQQEIEAAREFDRFRTFDVSDAEDLNTRIKDKDDEVYQFVESEITGQRENRSDLLTSDNNDIRKDVMRYLKDRYEERFERSRQAVSLYIQEYGLPNVIENIEDTMDVASDGALTRQEVEQAVSTQMEELSGRLHATLREQERVIRSDIADVEGEVLSIETSSEANVDTQHLESQLDEIKRGIEATRTERREDVQAIEEAIEQLSTRRAQLDEQVEKLESAAKQTVEQAASEAAESVAEDASTVIESELTRVKEQREKLKTELTQLSRERDQLEAAGDRLADERESLEERVERMSQSIPSEDSDSNRGVDVVPARIARLYEMDFISRFDESMEEATSIMLPGGEEYEPQRTFPEKTREKIDQRDRMESLLVDADRGDEAVDHYPLGARSRYTVVTSQRLGLVMESSLVIEAMVHSNLEAYATNGFDARPAGLDDLLDIINSATERAESRDTPHLIAAASTTGWTDRVRELVTEEEFSRTRLGSNVSLCLVDIQTGELLYDDTDEVVHSNRELFERAVRAERIEGCIKTIHEEYIEAPMEDVVTIDEVAEHGYQEHIVNSAFDRLENAGDADQEFHPDRGPYLIVG